MLERERMWCLTLLPGLRGTSGVSQKLKRSKLGELDRHEFLSLIVIPCALGESSWDSLSLSVLLGRIGECLTPTSAIVYVRQAGQALGVEKQNLNHMPVVGGFQSRDGEFSDWKCR